MNLSLSLSLNELAKILQGDPGRDAFRRAVKVNMWLS